MIHIKQSNGAGSIFKMHGNRRRPYVATVTVGFEMSENNRVVQKRKNIGYYATQKEARQALAEYNKMNIKPDTLDATLEDIWQILLPEKQETLSPSRLVGYRKAYERLEPIKKKTFRSLKTADFQKIIDACPTRSSSKKDIKILLSCCYKYALENDICVKDYSDFIKIEKDDVIIERHILSDMVCGFESAPFSPLNDITLILLYTGCRSKEILANSTLFDLEDETIQIQEAKNKTSVRTIPIHPKIKDAIKRYVDSPRPTYRQLYDYTKKLGFTPHDCRHTFTTRCHECGLNDLVVQKLLGHAPETITQAVYTHISMSEMRTELNKLNYQNPA